jgi:hypothetical protein
MVVAASYEQQPLGRAPPTAGVSDQHGSPDQPDTALARRRRTRPIPRRQKKKLWGCGAGFRAPRPVASQGRHSATIRGRLFSAWIRDTAVQRRSRGSTQNEPAADLRGDRSGAESGPVDPKAVCCWARGAGGSARRSARSRSRSADPFESETPFRRLGRPERLLRGERGRPERQSYGSVRAAFRRFNAVKRASMNPLLLIF